MFQINSTIFAINVVGNFRQKETLKVTWQARIQMKDHSSVTNAINGNEFLVF